MAVLQDGDLPAVQDSGQRTSAAISCFRALSGHRFVSREEPQLLSRRHSLLGGLMN